MAVAGTLLLTTAHGKDVKVLPPEVRSFESPSGAYVLEVLGTAGWKQPQARAELFSVSAEGRSRRWSAALPHRFGPGSAFVSDTGRVVMIDEWVKTPSQYAVALFAENGDMVSRHSMSDIATVSRVPASTLVTRARVGPWMSAAPALAPAQDSVAVEAGGVRLEISLDSGRISIPKTRGR